MKKISEEKAIDVVKQMVADGQVSQDVAEKYFPELKESGDERIRKSLSAYFAKFKPNDMWDADFSFGDIVAWFDRLGKQNQLIERGKWYVCIETYKFFVKGSAYQARNRYCINGDGDDCFVDGHDGKLSDYFRPWNVKDARDGDVLIFEGFYNSIVLFQGIGINGEGRINYHCKCDLWNYSFGVQGDVACLGTVERDAEHYHPATKEQRNLLFKKMHEAGYKWDAEKKELKEIEQKSADRYKEWYDFIRWFVKQRIDDYTLIPSDDDIHKWGDNILNHARKVLEPKPTEWSEDDERLFQIVIDILDRQNHLGNISRTDLIVCVRKLKSLRPQNWKPSKEQIIALRWVLNNVPYCTHKEEISGLLDQIKDL